MGNDRKQNARYFSIKSWAVEDRPREKMEKLGRGALTDAELIGILIGSGTTRESAIDIAKRILSSVENDLNKLGQLTSKDLKKFNGIGDAKAVTIAAALELGRRRRLEEPAAPKRIVSSKDAFNLMYPKLTELDHEQFYVILLQRNNAIIDVVRLSQGGVSGTVVDTKIIYKAALEKLAPHMIAVHNHPSGNPEPSQADIRLTEKLKDAGKIMEVKLIDHIILAGNTYYSFADSGHV